ncbi:MAG: carboxypeptidase regulatory-like domain-containing protein [Deltaproteobacteria bacterium]|nr:carboxypeptidase regulatory-like domain-containing protein [Deltaproteobacteria bacterium]
MKEKKYLSQGFTLIELIMVIVLIGIVAATAVSIIGNIINQQRFDETVKEMNELKMAMLGNPDLVQGGVRTSFGYVGDIGALPTNLTKLVSQGGLPSWTKTSTYDSSVADLGTGAGWLVPSYIDAKKDDSGNYLALYDGWGNAYSYNNATGQVTSTGGGSGNITIPETSQASVLAGNVTGQVRGTQGGALQGATVTIYYPNGSGVHTTQSTPTDSNGRYSFTNIPIGRRTIKVASGVLILSDVVVIYGGQTQTKDIIIQDTIASEPPTNLTITRASYTSLNLTWTASTSPDVAGYRIYRGVASGGEVLYKTGITGTSYIDDNNGVGLSKGTTYYYRMSAVDTAGNESALTVETDETASPIQQSGVATLGSQNPPGTCSAAKRKSVDLNIINNDLSAITVDFIRVTWNGGGTLREIDSPIGTARYSSTTGQGSPYNFDVTNFSVGAGSTQTMRLFFCTDGTDPSSITLEFNSSVYDGRIDTITF